MINRWGSARELAVEWIKWMINRWCSARKLAAEWAEMGHKRKKFFCATMASRSEQPAASAFNFNCGC